ncbi:hypothetical protein K2173_005463 [Erythroxylum novogranatense]|uniref:Secreted protein n=1 Tax=Erythroxylum novogranatense TaxID=1862640 RepID=A0AAV8SKJ7_9ROSI|nr:hypothetical protein K2173_005463 [Erythroxylum novogranatense]
MVLKLKSTRQALIASQLFPFWVVAADSPAVHTELQTVKFTVDGVVWSPLTLTAHVALVLKSSSRDSLVRGNR